MNLPTPPDGDLPRYFGVYPAIVTDSADPESLGRVEVHFPWLGGADRDLRAWATLCSSYAYDDQTPMVLPEVGSQVVVAFEAGDLRRPYILGAAWNSTAAQPERRPSGDDHLRVLKTRSGSRLEFDDAGDNPKITLVTPQGYRVVLDDSARKASVSTASGHEVTLDDTVERVDVVHASGCTVTLSTTSVTILGNVSVEVIAPKVKVDASLAEFSGVLKADTMIATTSVVSPSYTPGVGNLL
jgi:uncharacterized protein involved in type VI secretion and phage assembly